MACLAGKKGCPGPGGDLCFTCRSLAKTSAATATQVKFPGIKAPEARPVPKDPPHIIVLPTTGADGSSKIALYRGDTRGPGNMKKHGFELWGAAIACVSKAGGMSNYLRAKCAELVDGRSLVRIFCRGRRMPTRQLWAGQNREASI